MIFVKLLARLPWGVLLGISNSLYFLGYVLGRYRYPVVIKNLRRSFPEKGDKELKSLARKFYTAFFDFFVETLRAVNISSEELRQRVKIINPEIMENIPRDRAVIVMASHTFNWELCGIGVSEFFERQLVFGYQKLTNPFFDSLMYKTRSQFGAEGMLRHETAKTIVRGRKDFKWFMILGDQAPVGIAQRFWTRFLNQDTSFYHGVGQIAKVSNLGVLALLPRKVKRGFYEVRFEWVEQDPSTSTAEEILENYARILNRELLECPSEWLWTHKRWKNKKRDKDVLSETVVQ